MRRHLLEISLLLAVLAVGFWLWRPQPQITMLGVIPGSTRAEVEEQIGKPSFEVSGEVEYWTEHGNFTFFYVGEELSYSCGPALEINGEKVGAEQLTAHLGEPSVKGKFQKWFHHGVTRDSQKLYLRPRESRLPSFL